MEDCSASGVNAWEEWKEKPPSSSDLHLPSHPAQPYLVTDEKGSRTGTRLPSMASGNCGPQMKSLAQSDRPHPNLSCLAPSSPEVFFPPELSLMCVLVWLGRRGSVCGWKSGCWSRPCRESWYLRGLEEKDSPVSCLQFEHIGLLAVVRGFCG